MSPSTLLAISLACVRWQATTSKKTDCAELSPTRFYDRGNGSCAAGTFEYVANKNGEYVFQIFEESMMADWSGIAPEQKTARARWDTDEKNAINSKTQTLNLEPTPRESRANQPIKHLWPHITILIITTPFPQANLSLPKGILGNRSIKETLL